MRKSNGRIFLYLMCGIPLMIIGCGYTTRPGIVDTGIRTINVVTFKNRTYEHGLEVMVTNRVIREFIFDGTLKLVEGSRADAQLSGEVTDYIIKPLTYDLEGESEECRLRVEANLVLKDLRRNVILWEKNGLSGDAIYHKVGTLARSKAEAREEAIAELSENIVSEVVEVW